MLKYASLAVEVLIVLKSQHVSNDMPAAVVHMACCIPSTSSKHAERRPVQLSDAKEGKYQHFTHQADNV
jgi:hypothetical protein